jgi:8-oxo-dGTP pyrophosphatase MutT (NUDIX family)
MRPEPYRWSFPLHLNSFVVGTGLVAFVLSCSFLQGLLTMPHVPTRSAVVRPRDAASLLIYRRHAEQVQVLMGKRRPGARFLPDVYVFPGGALDAADALDVASADAKAQANAATAHGTASRPRSTLPPQWVQAMAARDEIHAAALLRAALRESQEESGWRWADASLATLEGKGLRYLGRAITPAQSPRRFHARFFAVPHERMLQDPHADGELLDLRWVDVRNPQRLPIIDVTEFMLAELQRALAGECEGLPLLSYVNDRVRVRRRPMA